MTRIALSDGTTKEITGRIVRLTVGRRKIRCILHDGVVSDVRSGRRIGSYRDMQILAMCRLSTYHKLTDRQAAQAVLDDLVRLNGAEHVLAVISAAPAI